MEKFKLNEPNVKKGLSTPILETLSKFKNKVILILSLNMILHSNIYGENIINNIDTISQEKSEIQKKNKLDKDFLFKEVPGYEYVNYSFYEKGLINTSLNSNFGDLVIKTEFNTYNGYDFNQDPLEFKFALLYDITNDIKIKINSILSKGFSEGFSNIYNYKNLREVILKYDFETNKIDFTYQNIIDQKKDILTVDLNLNSKIKLGTYYNHDILNDDENYGFYIKQKI